jgi:hypothetical protein
VFSPEPLALSPRSPFEGAFPARRLPPLPLAMRAGARLPGARLGCCGRFDDVERPAVAVAGVLSLAWVREGPLDCAAVDSDLRLPEPIEEEEEEILDGREPGGQVTECSTVILALGPRDSRYGAAPGSGTVLEPDGPGPPGLLDFEPDVDPVAGAVVAGKVPDVPDVAKRRARRPAFRTTIFAPSRSRRRARTSSSSGVTTTP